VGGDPNLKLAESRFQLFFVLTEELMVFWAVVYIYKNSKQFISKTLALMLPGSLNDLRFHETALNWRSSSRSVSPIKLSGTGCRH
jgi:hypothetical protein